MLTKVDWTDFNKITDLFLDYYIFGNYFVNDLFSNISDRPRCYTCTVIKPILFSHYRSRVCGRLIFEPLQTPSEIMIRTMSYLDIICVGKINIPLYSLWLYISKHEDYFEINIYIVNFNKIDLLRNQRINMNLLSVSIENLFA